MGPCLGNNNVDQVNKIKNLKLEIGGHHLVVQQKLASGAYGDIWKCKDIKTGELMAAKQIKLQSIELSEMFNKEVKWLSKLNGSQGIVKYMGSKVISGRQRSKNGVGWESGIIITEFYEMSLFDLVKNKKFSVEEVRDFLSQIVKTLQIIHEAGCLHLDLKIENILCSNGHSGKRSYFICDFGSCIGGEIKVEGMERKQKHKLKQFIQCNSTLIYRAPEMVELNKTPITTKADIWMLGCVLYMLIFRKHPFEGQGLLSIVTANINFNINLDLQGAEGPAQKSANQLLNLVKGMLQVKIEDRLSEDEILRLLQSF